MEQAHLEDTAYLNPTDLDLTISLPTTLPAMEVSEPPSLQVESEKVCPVEITKALPLDLAHLLLVSHLELLATLPPLVLLMAFQSELRLPLNPEVLVLLIPVTTPLVPLALTQAQLVEVSNTTLSDRLDDHY